MGQDLSELRLSAHPRLLLTPRPGEGFADRLNEREIGTDRLGGAHQITEMSDEYLWAVRSDLRRRAPPLRALVRAEWRAEPDELAQWRERLASEGS